MMGRQTQECCPIKMPSRRRILWESLLASLALLPRSVVIDRAEGSPRLTSFTGGGAKSQLAGLSPSTLDSQLLSSDTWRTAPLSENYLAIALSRHLALASKSPNPTLAFAKLQVEKFPMQPIDLDEEGSGRNEMMERRHCTSCSCSAFLLHLD